MNPPDYRLITRAARFGALLCAIVPAALFAQTALATSPAATSAPGAKKDDAVILSPFEVSSSTDEGYAARETLSGTRFKSDLKDVPSEVQIFTKEFLEDIASVSIEDAFRYSANVENATEYFSPTSGGGDFNSGVLNTRSSNRIRGLSSPGLTHDFFQSTVLQDSYNVERVSISSGPNAILFGNGNPGGIIDSSFSRASVSRPKYSVSFRNDNYRSLRLSVDLDQPLIKDKLGLRIAAVNSRQNSWRKPSGRDDDRIYYTITAKPFKDTTVRAYFEDSMIANTQARNVRFGDQVTPWINAGRPAFNNGLTNPTLITAANNSIFARNTSTTAQWLLGYTASNAYIPYGSAATAVITTPTTRYTANTIGPGSSPNQTGTDSYIYSLPNNEDVSPFDVSVNGNGTRYVMYGKIWGGSIEQRLPGNFFLQLDFNREQVVNPISDFIRGISSAVRADANVYLPDRVTPNPNYGRYYVEGGTRVFSFRGEKKEARAMLSYEHDFTTEKNWQKWLGKHRAAGMYQRSESMEVQQEFGPRIIPTNVAYNTALDNYGGPLYNTFGFRAYLSDPKKSETGTQYSLVVPFDPVRTTSYIMPDGSTYYAGYKNPYGAQSSTNMPNNLVESQVFALQDYFLKNRLVTSFGWRKDKVRQATYTTQRKTAAANSAFESIYDLSPPTNWSTFTGGNTNTMGAVLHILPWLSGFYNKSSTWNPPTPNINPDDGSPVPGSTGKGKDYGIMLRFLNDRLSFRLNKYENTSGPDSNTGFRNAIIPIVQNIENTLIDRTNDGTIKAPPKTNYDSTGGVYDHSTLTSDLVSTGYELGITANPTRNIRFNINGSYSTATQSNIGKNWVNFINQRAAVWAANPTLTGPGNDNTPISSRYLGIIQVLNQMAQADGQRVEDGRQYRANAVARYTFTEGVLRGGFLGGGYQWRSAQNLGYRSVLVDNAFKLPGAPAQVLVPAINSPITGEQITAVEAILGYSRKIGRRIGWRVQLNIRNLFDDGDPQASRANLTSGFVTVYTVPEPRSFILTNTFTF